MEGGDNLFLMETFIYCLLLKKRKTKARTKWCKKWLLRRQVHTHINLLKDLREDPNEWRSYMRMDENAYKELLRLITPLIERQNTVMRKSISPHERLSCTLRFLATGRSYRDLRFTAAISHQSLSTIIPETCRAIYKVLWKEYMQVPQSQADWKIIATEFESKWNFPHCLGAVDGKHIRIKPSSRSGSYFYNYKGFHSMVLMAVVNANYEFIISEFGVNGRISDGGVIEQTTFYKRMRNNSLCIPEQEKISNSDRILNYTFIGDEAFALTPNFLKPFSRRNLTDERRIFNYRLSRARRVVENAFGILATRFRIFHTCINLDLANIDIVVMTCCVLHNFLRRKYSTSYTPIGSLDFEDTIHGTVSLGLRTNDSNLINVERGHYRAIPTGGQDVRQKFLDYFNNEGSVPWQNRLCNINTLQL